jgi:outer membrane receptor for ferrienterochelin and colicin
MKKLSLSLAIASALAASTAIGQNTDAPASDTDENTELEAIKVTGSHIRGVDLEGAVPVQVITSEEIRASGANSVIELLAELPQLGGGTGTFSSANSGARQADTPVGAAGLSLRGLGASSTLTLVNGRRVQVSSFANGSESFIDVNAIPYSAIDRVEILASGASATYGADAVAGVVNIILREDFEGLETRFSYNDSTRNSDESRTAITATWGKRLETGNIMVTADYFKRNALYDRDREFSAVEPRPSQQGVFPSFNLDPDLFELDVVENGCPDDQFGEGRFGEFCELNRNAYTAQVPATERFGALAAFNLELGNNVRWFNELMISRNRSKADSDPAPWSGIDISLNHPNVPPGLQQRFDGIVDTLADFGLEPRLRGWGRFPDARTLSNTSENARLLSGLSGYWGQWDWESAINIGYNRNRQEATAGIINVARYEAALFGELCPDGSTNCSPDGEGLWYSPFNAQTGNSQQVLDLLNAKVPRDGRSRLASWDFNLSGMAFETANGPAMLAVGGEIRYESIEDNPSELAQADPDNNFEVPVYGFGSTQAEASRSQRAIYGELFVPLTASLDMQVAGRLDDYTDFGADFNPKIALRWQAMDNLVFRGSWGTSFRAPSLAQTGAGLTLSSGALPCGPASEFFETFCDGFDEDDFYLSEIFGNPDLQPEESEAINLGFSWDITPDTNLTMDYWSFNHSNLVDINADELFRRALQDPSLVFAEGELPPGQIGIETRTGVIGSPIELVRLELINIGRQKTNGFDLGLTQHFRTEKLGRFRWTLDGTYLDSYTQEIDSVEVTEVGAGFFTYPRIEARTRLSWYYGDWEASVSGRYTHSYRDDFERAEVPVDATIPSWTIWDLTLIHDLDADSWVRLTVDNVFDRDPPLTLGSSRGVDLFNHNGYGRVVGLLYVRQF